MIDVTQILNRIERGEPQAAGELLPLVYDELRKLAASKMRQEKPGQTLDATALVHEAYLRLVKSDSSFENRSHFFAAAAEAMRRILVESARRKSSLKRGGRRPVTDLSEGDWISTTTPDEVLAVDDALTQLAKEDPQAAAIVKLRYYAGFSVEEAADALGLTRSTAYRHWTYARAWIRSAISESSSFSAKDAAE
jgi:RNA polymerase sigma factor (TIGR02999 family)